MVKCYALHHFVIFLCSLKILNYYSGKIYLRSIEMEFEDVMLVFLTIAVWNLALKEYDKDSLMCLAYMMSITKVSQLLKNICFCVDL